MKRKIVFAILSYNHADYIIEHLESIKYLIVHHGKNYDFKLVMADDGSRDKTVELVRFWLTVNKELFLESVILADGINRGTCANYVRLCENIDSDYFKITAGDDVYSQLDFFDQFDKLDRYGFISGQPVLLIDGVLSYSDSAFFHLAASYILYRQKTFFKRLASISVINTPSLIYRRDVVRNKAVSDFIKNFKVVEDFPMMIKVAEVFPEIRFLQLHDVYVYYRRTKGSTYLVRKNDFKDDKLKTYLHMIQNEKSIWSRVLLVNRAWCYRQSNLLFRAFLNVNYYVYFALICTHFLKIFQYYKCGRRSVNLDLHKEHYKEIQLRCREFMTKFETEKAVH